MKKLFNDWREHSLPELPLGLLLISLAIIYINSLFNHGLIPSMEPRFAQVITEMMATGQYLIPIKNGWPYVEYPPLLYWLAILPAKLGLPVEASIRLPCYVALIVWVLYLDKLQKLLFKEWPAHTLALLGASLPAVLWHFFTAQTDSLLATGVLVACVGFIRVRLGMAENRFPWELWVGVALATAAKGPVGIVCTLPVMVLEIFISIFIGPGTGQSGKQRVVLLYQALRPIAWIRGLSFLILTTLPWYLATGIVHGADFVRAVVVYQNFDRYLTGFDHLQPWWYYFGAVLAGMFPISLLVPLGVWAATKRMSRLPERMAVSWALFTFLFFSISASKQGKYILPAAPAFLLLGLIGLEATFETGKLAILAWLKRWAVSLITIWGVLVIFILPFYSHKIAHVDDYQLIREVITSKPGRLISYQWPRAMMLYQLGSPMDFVRSSRELYEKIQKGEIHSGDYLLVSKRYFPDSQSSDISLRLIPSPGEPRFEHVLDLETERRLQVYRVLPGAEMEPVPKTPEPQEIIWRDVRFDTD